MNSQKQPGLTQFQRVIAALLFSNSVSVGLFVIRALSSASIRYWFLLWNLVLAWLPLLFVYLLRERLKTTRWLTWQNLLLSLLWLGFLPNSFYLASDLVHLHSTGEVSLLYDAVMFSSFMFNGFVAGMTSLAIVHTELQRRLKPRAVQIIVGLVLLASSFAIYLGRSLRWNTWDVLINPAGILFDVSERVINPTAHDQAFATTGVFFLLLASLYVVVWQFVGLLRSKQQ